MSITEYLPLLNLLYIIIYQTAHNVFGSFVCNLHLPGAPLLASATPCVCLVLQHLQHVVHLYTSCCSTYAMKQTIRSPHLVVLTPCTTTIPSYLAAPTHFSMDTSFHIPYILQHIPMCTSFISIYTKQQFPIHTSFSRTYNMYHCTPVSCSTSPCTPHFATPTPHSTLSVRIIQQHLHIAHFTQSTPIYSMPHIYFIQQHLHHVVHPGRPQLASTPCSKPKYTSCSSTYTMWHTHCTLNVTAPTCCSMLSHFTTPARCSTSSCNLLQLNLQYAAHPHFVIPTHCIVSPCTSHLAAPTPSSTPHGHVI